MGHSSGKYRTEQWKEKEIEYNGNLENKKRKACPLKKGKLL